MAPEMLLFVSTFGLVTYGYLWLLITYDLLLMLDSQTICDQTC